MYFHRFQLKIQKQLLHQQLMKDSTYIQWPKNSRKGYREIVTFHFVCFNNTTSL